MLADAVAHRSGVARGCGNCDGARGGNRSTVDVRRDTGGRGAATGAAVAALPAGLAAGRTRPGRGRRAAHDRGRRATVLTWHPNTNTNSNPSAAREARSVRRGLVTFPHVFANREPVSLIAEARPKPTSAGAHPVDPLPVEIHVNGSAVSIAYRDGPSLTCPAAGAGPAVGCCSDRGNRRDQRLFPLATRAPGRPAMAPRDRGPRRCVGGVALVAHLQRNLAGDAYGPSSAGRSNPRPAPAGCGPAAMMP